MGNYELEAYINVDLDSRSQICKSSGFPSHQTTSDVTIN